MRRRSDLQELSYKYNHLRMRLKGASSLMGTVRGLPYSWIRGPSPQLSKETAKLARDIQWDIDRLYELVVDDWLMQRHTAKRRSKIKFEADLKELELEL